jgi:hypothetical protein
MNTIRSQHDGRRGMPASNPNNITIIDRDEG